MWLDISLCAAYSAVQRMLSGLPPSAGELSLRLHILLSYYDNIADVCGVAYQNMYYKCSNAI